MEDDWSLSVGVFEVELSFEVDLERGARVVGSECDCDAELVTDGGKPSAQCRHTRLARARIENIFDDREWDEVRDRLGLPDDPVSVEDAPAQWGPLLEGE